MRRNREEDEIMGLPPRRRLTLSRRAWEIVVGGLLLWVVISVVAIKALG